MEKEIKAEIEKSNQRQCKFYCPLFGSSCRIDCVSFRKAAQRPTETHVEKILEADKSPAERITFAGCLIFSKIAKSLPLPVSRYTQRELSDRIHDLMGMRLNFL